MFVTEQTMERSMFNTFGTTALHAISMHHDFLAEVKKSGVAERCQRFLEERGQRLEEFDVQMAEMFGNQVPTYLQQYRKNLEEACANIRAFADGTKIDTCGGRYAAGQIAHAEATMYSIFCELTYAH